MTLVLRKITTPLQNYRKYIFFIITKTLDLPFFLEWENIILNKIIVFKKIRENLSYFSHVRCFKIYFLIEESTRWFKIKKSPGGATLSIFTHGLLLVSATTSQFSILRTMSPQPCGLKSSNRCGIHNASTGKLKSNTCSSVFSPVLNIKRGVNSLVHIFGK